MRLLLQVPLWCFSVAFEGGKEDAVVGWELQSGEHHVLFEHLRAVVEVRYRELVCVCACV